METTSRTCRWVCRRLPLHVGGELGGVDRRRVERHLITCLTCRNQQAALVHSLSVLQEVAGSYPARIVDHLQEEAPSVWPALARQIREAKHEASRARTWGTGISRFVGSGMAASLILGLTWFWSVHSAPRPWMVRVDSRLASPVPGIPQAASDSRPAVPGSIDSDPTPTLIALDKLAVPFHSSEALGSALPEGEELRAVVPAKPGFDPFQPPLTLRLDYDLDRGVSSSPATRDTQRAY